MLDDYMPVLTEITVDELTEGDVITFIEGSHQYWRALFITPGGNFVRVLWQGQDAWCSIPRGRTMFRATWRSADDVSRHLVRPAGRD